MSEHGSLELVDVHRVLVRPTSDPGELLDYAESHLWERSQDANWRSPLTVQFEQPLPKPLNRAIGTLVESRPAVQVYAYDHADPSLVWLQEMPALEHLSIGLHTVERFDQLAALPRLRSLDLPQTIGTRPSLGVLAKLGRLEELSIAGQAKDFDAVSGLSCLRSLSLYASRVRDLDPLAGATRLELLNLGFGRIRDFTPLTALPALRGLSIWKTGGMTADHLAALGDIPALEALDLGAMRTVETLAPLRGGRASTLRYLLLEGMGGLRDYGGIAALDALEQIGVWGSGPVDPDVGPLLAAPALRAIVIERGIPKAEADRLVDDFRGQDLFIDGARRRGSPLGVRVGWRAGLVDMLRASVHGRQWIGSSA